MPIWWYTQSKEAKNMKSGTIEEWDRVKKQFIINHPVKHAINEIWDFFYYPIKRTWENLSYFFRISLPSFFVRGWRGWADCDTWGWYAYNARIQRDVLKHLKKTKHGIPSVVTSDKVELDQDDNPTYNEFKRMEKAWNEIIDNMIRAFDYIVQCDEGKLDYYSDTYDQKWMIEHEKKFNIKFMTKEQDEDMKKGFELYFKYYMSLWD